jgi:VanZ family protein
LNACDKKLVKMVERVTKSAAVLWGAPLAWMAVIYVLSDQSNLPTLSTRFDYQGVVGHLIVYAVLAVLWRRAFVAAGLQRYGWWAFGVTLIYGFLDEYHQYFVPNRVPDVLDIATDAVGALVGLWISALIQRRGRQQ